MHLDARRRRVTVAGRSTVLQEKTWQVLSILRARAPEVVSRRDLIGHLWQGNYLTGEKGLNQAVWAIRAALCDDARDPRFIRTVPRVGYQWIHAGHSRGETRAARPMRSVISKAAGIAALFVIPTVATSILIGVPDIHVEATKTATERVATKAYLVDRDIHVEFADGCLGILKNDSYLKIGTPVLSADGAEIAVTLSEAGNCRLVTIDVANGQRQDFGSCPSDVI